MNAHHSSSSRKRNSSLTQQIGMISECFVLVFYLLGIVNWMVWHTPHVTHRFVTMATHIEAPTNNRGYVELFGGVVHHKTIFRLCSVCTYSISKRHLLMTTLKPLPSSKPKKPVYFNEIVQVYDFVRIKAKGEHNPSDALEELKKQLDKKKTIKSALKAKEEALHFKKKGAAGKSLPLKQVPYSAIKAFYQFSGNPTFMVMGVHGKEIPKQYIILATSSPGKTNKLFEVLQMAQWAPANNLKNEVPAVVIDERLIVENTSKSSGTPVKTPTTESRTSSRTSSSLSSSTRPPLVQSKARSSSDSTFRARSNSSSSHTEKREQRKRSSPLRSSKIESNRDKSNSSACQIPVENGDSKSSYFFYEPRRPHSKGGQRSRRSTRSATYLASSESSSDSRSKGDVKNAKPQLPVGGVLLMTGLKPDKFGRIKSRASSESRLASKIYYVQPGANKTSSDSGSSSDSQNETIFVIKSGRASKAGASH